MQPPADQLAAPATTARGAVPPVTPPPALAPAPPLPRPGGGRAGAPGGGPGGGPGGDPGGGHAGERLSPGRRQRTTRQAIEASALALFVANGYEETTVDDIAAAARIGRRTFFRYFASKNDVAWGEFDAELARLRDELASTPTGMDLAEAIKVAVVRANCYGPDDLPRLRQRLRLLVRVPALQAHAMLRYAAWQRVVAEFAGQRLGLPADGLVPQAIARAALGVAQAAYGIWVDQAETALGACLEEALGLLATGLRPMPDR